MSFNAEIFKKEFSHRLTNGLGWSAEIAGSASTIAVEVIKSTHGGERHYIPSKNTDREKIIAEYKSGVSIEKLARNQGITTRTIRNIVK